MEGSASAVYTLINSYLADRLPDLYVQIDDEITNFPFVSVGEAQSIKLDSKYFEHYEITQTIRLYHNDINERVTLENIIHKLITELENVSYKVNGWQLDLLNYNYDISVEIDTSTQKYLRLFCELTFKGLSDNEHFNIGTVTEQPTNEPTTEPTTEPTNEPTNEPTTTYTNMVVNGDFSKGAENWKLWNTNQADLATTNDGKFVWKGVGTGYYQTVTTQANHVLYIYAECGVQTNEIGVYCSVKVGESVTSSPIYRLSANNSNPIAKHGAIVTSPSDSLTVYIQKSGTNSDNTVEVWADNIKIYDLTEIFGSGNEPTLAEFEKLLV